MFYLNCDTVRVALKSYEDNSVKIKTLGLKAALVAFSLSAPGKINDKLASGVSIEKWISKIPIICMLNLS